MNAKNGVWGFLFWTVGSVEDWLRSSMMNDGGFDTGKTMRIPNQRPNGGQEDANNNLVGDVCDTLNDRDMDGVPDEVIDQYHQ